MSLTSYVHFTWARNVGTKRGVSALLNLILQRSADTLDVLQLHQGVFLHSMWEGAVF